MKKAVFLDRDGVLNRTIFRRGKSRAPYTMDEFSFLEGVHEAIELLKRNHFLLVIVTNQPDAARGWVTREQIDLVNAHVKETLEVDEIKACFHVNEDNCQCRKPRPGMIIEASKEWNIDLSQSFMVGDRLSDVEAGLSAGCKSILVGPGDGVASQAAPDHQCEGLLNAARWILGQNTQSP